jgi:hypothetical protein
MSVKSGKGLELIGSAGRRERIKETLLAYYVETLVSVTAQLEVNH